MKNGKGIAEERMLLRVKETLKTVNVPGSGRSVYDLKMVEEIRVVGDEVHLFFNPKSKLCSGLQLAFDVRKALKSVEGIRRVELHVRGDSVIGINGSKSK